MKEMLYKDIQRDKLLNQNRSYDLNEKEQKVKE